MCWMLDETNIYKSDCFFYIYLSRFQLFPNLLIAALLVIWWNKYIYQVQWLYL